MLLLKIRLKIALDLSNGPDTEEFEFHNHDEIQKFFSDFSKLSITQTQVKKDGVPIGTIFEGEADNA